MRKTLFIFAAILLFIISCTPCNEDNSNTNCDEEITIDSIYTTNVIVDESVTLNLSWNDDVNTSWDVFIYNPDNTVFAQRINTTIKEAEFLKVRVNTEYRLEIRGRQNVNCPLPYNSALKIGNTGDVQKPR